MERLVSTDGEFVAPRKSRWPFMPSISAMAACRHSFVLPFMARTVSPCSFRCLSARCRRAFLGARRRTVLPESARLPRCSIAPPSDRVHTALFRARRGTEQLNLPIQMRQSALPASSSSARCRSWTVNRIRTPLLSCTMSPTTKYRFQTAMPTRWLHVLGTCDRRLGHRRILRASCARRNGRL